MYSQTELKTALKKIKVIFQANYFDVVFQNLILLTASKI